MPVKHVRNIPSVAVSAGEHTSMQVLICSEEGAHFAMRRFRMAPGGSMPAHTNTIEHEQYVLQGRAEVGIGDDVVQVEPGSVVYIPAAVPHWYRTVGEETFEFLCMVPNGPDRIELTGSEE